jgi:hypothetical protein
MDFANRGNRPNAAPQQSAPQQQEQAPQSFKPMNNEGKKKKKLDFGKITSGLLLVGTTFLVLALILGLVFGIGGQASESDLIQEDKYQAVFLNSQDGQVYFGKLDVYNQDIYQLTDIYYVRVENPIQPEGANQQAQPNISLAKLGNELHGPQDAMFIRRDQVLYWENLKDDGQVVTAITEFKANGGEEAQNQQQTQQQTQQTQPAGTPQQDDTAPADTTPTVPTPDTDTTPETPTAP